jgi:sugar phosphate permease
MKHAVLALILGAFAYIAVMATAPIGMVLDANYWRERRDIALIGVVALFGLVMWAAMFLPPGSGLNELASYPGFRGRL